VVNTQAETGFVKVPNEFWDALCRLRIPGEARQVFDFILRKTLGWNKKADQISLSQISLGTGLNKAKVIRARHKLIALNLIVISQKGNGNNATYSINMNFSAWKPFPKKETFPKKEMIVPQKGNKTFPKKGHTKDNKDTIQKTIFLSDSVEYRLAKLLLDLILQRRSEFKIPNLNQWCRQIDLLIRVDKRTPAEIEETIRAAQKDPFWQNNILSPKKLREKYDQLRLKLFLPPRSFKPDTTAILRETLGGVQ